MDKAKINKILVISLSNIGDIILTFPVLDILKNDFPEAKISVVVGTKGEALLKDNPHFEHVYIYQKRQPVDKILSWLWQLRKERFNLVVDLRNTAIPFLIGSWRRTSFVLRRSQSQHMREQHLNRLQSVYAYRQISPQRYALFINEEDRRSMDETIAREVERPDKMVVVSPGAADERKRWTDDGFAQVCDRLVRSYQINVVFIGDKSDQGIIAQIMKKMKLPAVDLSGRATLTQVAHLLKRSKLLLSNDSAPMHLASYLDVPVVALFGPTNPVRYGPWGRGSLVIKKYIQSPDNKQQQVDGMKLIAAQDVLDGILRQLVNVRS